jgi:hypothetical protein
MASQTRRRLWRSTLVATLVGIVGLVALAVSAAWASIPDSTGTIHACYTNVGGLLRVIDTDKGQTCKSWEKALDWNQAPPAPPAALPDSFVVTSPGVQEVSNSNFALAELLLPAGRYQVTAKVQLGNSAAAARRVGCQLTPANEDGSPGNVGEQSGEDASALHLAPAGQPGETGELTFLVSQTLDEEGPVRLTCGSDVPTPTSVIAIPQIRAVEVGSITNSSWPQPLP